MSEPATKMRKGRPKPKALEPAPKVKKFMDALMDKRLVVRLNADRQVSGTLRGHDLFRNLVLEDAVDDKTHSHLGQVMIRGSSIVTFEVLNGP